MIYFKSKSLLYQLLILYRCSDGRRACGAPTLSKRNVDFKPKVSSAGYGRILQYIGRLVRGYFTLTGEVASEANFWLLIIQSLKKWNFLQSEKLTHLVIYKAD